jgi:hypothetical protein
MVSAPVKMVLQSLYHHVLKWCYQHKKYVAPLGITVVLQIASTNLLVQLEIVHVHVCVRIHVCVCPKNLLVSQREQLQT